MKCPHCGIAFHAHFTIVHEVKDCEGRWQIHETSCPECEKVILVLAGSRFEGGQWPLHTRYLVRPKTTSTDPVPKEVPEKFACDYKEACLVLADSPKASAALSRRCLQHILREKAGVKKGNLAQEIEEVIDKGDLPTHLEESLDAVRNIGNFATHPIKGTSSGEIVEVEPGEAEWNLDVLEALFDFYFVQPARTQAKRDALNKKLAEAGKPPMKGPTQEEQGDA